MPAGKQVSYSVAFHFFSLHNQFCEDFRPYIPNIRFHFKQCKILGKINFSLLDLFLEMLHGRTGLHESHV
jgi:hypothetical protein